MLLSLQKKNKKTKNKQCIYFSLCVIYKKKKEIGEGGRRKICCKTCIDS